MTTQHQPITLLTQLILFFIAALLIIQSGAAVAGDDTQKLQYNIPAQALADALRTFSEKSGLQLLYDANLAAGKRSAALRGVYLPQEALGRLLVLINMQKLPGKGWNQH